MHCFRLYLLLVTLIFNLNLIIDSADVCAETKNISDSSMTVQDFSGEQVHTAGIGLYKDGASMPEEIIKSLKGSPEFKGLTPEEIVKGKELLDKKEPEPNQKPEGAVKSDYEQIKSLFDRYRSIGTYQDISTDLRPFGYDFFSEYDEKALMPRKDVPVSSDYIIGPGDEVRIMLWGRVNAQYNLEVDRDGNITIPQIGPLQVSG
ncbi:MAG: polysaccharide biosynthesis/export family protein, partial [Nitrospirota bacterium]